MEMATAFTPAAWSSCSRTRRSSPDSIRPRSRLLTVDSFGNDNDLTVAPGPHRPAQPRSTARTRAVDRLDALTASEGDNMAVRIGLQLYSVRNALAESSAATFKGIADLGYRYLEAANHHARTDPGVGFGVRAAELRDHARPTSACRSSAATSTRWTSTRSPRALDYQAELGNTQIGCDIEFYPLRRPRLRAATLRYLQQGRRARARTRGMRFYYHNHFQEFQRFGSDYVYDIILANTDPELGLPRAGHLLGVPGRAGPARVDEPATPTGSSCCTRRTSRPTRRSRSTCTTAVVIDATENIDDTVFTANARTHCCFTEIGTGVLPIQDIIDTAGTLPNLQYMFLEQDYSRLPDLDSIARSRDAFSHFTGISWE